MGGKGGGGGGGKGGGGGGGGGKGGGGRSGGGGGGKGGGGMMVAPGRGGGAYISRGSFESDPKGYFDGLHQSGGNANKSPTCFLLLRHHPLTQTPNRICTRNEKNRISGGGRRMGGGGGGGGGKCGGGGGMMVAPGSGEGAYISRGAFESDPKGYFDGLHQSGGNASK
ncbi:PREDICTED: putative glycine-rich cell wall structural protein 1 [Tarenaya hassleriana]|uniref:putative glycine-rich cell wall structural protein 1 n=1 Tax=Tarenaya hassleriana TaxID=28532 RepID=UPI00053C9905|nr:PREDICTED: putative glycine-rich cell wall structural protein 1 [Tarenaya hassleriana]